MLKVCCMEVFFSVEVLESIGLVLLNSFHSGVVKAVDCDSNI